MDVKNWCLKKSKRWVAVIAVIAVMLCLIAVAACDANPKESVEVQETSGLDGNYLFETGLYMNPLSSFYPFDGHVEYYTFTEDALVITNETGLQTIVPVKYKKVAVDAKAFKAAFDIDVAVPDITKYKERYQYILNESTSTNPEYQLYLMDSEVWLARMNSGSMWSIYKLTRFDGDRPSLLSEGNIIVLSGNNTVSDLSTIAND